MVQKFTLFRYRIAESLLTAIRLTTFTPVHHTYSRTATFHATACVSTFLHTSRSSHWKNGLSPEADFGKPTVFRKLCTTCSHSLPFERHTRRHPVEQCCPYQDVLMKDKHTRRDFLSESLQGAAHLASGVITRNGTE